jgi:hypothetical protein
MAIDPRLPDDVVAAQLKEEIAAWVNGNRSYQNLGPNPPYTPDVIAAMDAQEVVKLSAAYQAFMQTYLAGRD